MPTQVASHPFGVVSIGYRDGQEITVDLPAIGGLALTGPGASSAIRALVVTALATVPQVAVEIVVAGTDLAQEVAPHVASVPGLTIAHDLDAALRQLEVELLYRARLLDESDVTTLAEFTAINPAEPLPLLILVAETPAPILSGRLAAILDAAGPLGITAVILGDIPGTPALTVSPDGGIDVYGRELPDPLQALNAAHLFVLGPHQASETLELLTASRSEPSATPSLPQDPAIPSVIEPELAPDGRGARVAAVEPSAGLQAPSPFAPALGASESPPIQIRVLGPMRVEAGGSDVHARLRGKARELLALLLTHPDGIASEAAVETLWPDAPPPRGAERLQTVISNLRTTLKAAADLEREEKVVTYGGRRYTIDADLFECDLWRFNAALATAASTTDTPSQVEALSQAVATYGGAFAEGERYPWAEAPREGLRRHALNAATRLAELHQQAGQLDAALAPLEQALTWEPHAEELYRRIMRLQATLGRPDAVQRTYDQLAGCLDDLDAEPDDSTRQLLNELLGSTSPGVRRPSS